MRRNPQFGPYWMLRRVGNGDLAEVFVAIYMPEGRRVAQGEPIRAVWKSAASTAPLAPGALVAVKRIWREMATYREVHRLLAREGRLAAELDHPNVARTFDVGDVGGRPYICMEYVPGADLAHLLARVHPRRLPIGVALRVILDICSALEYVHRASSRDRRPLHIIHGDITPTNILVSTCGVSKLIDFSVAVSDLQDEEDEEDDDGHTVRGTYGYMSPEQARGEAIDQRTDIFALGVVLWETLTGQRLFRRAANYLTLAAVVEDPAPPLEAANADLCGDLGGATSVLDHILRRALAKRREDRYPDISEFASDLRALTEEEHWDLRSWTLQSTVRALLSEPRAR